MTDLVSTIKQFWRCLGFDIEISIVEGEIKSNLFRGMPRSADSTLPARIWIASTEMLAARANPERVA